MKREWQPGDVARTMRQGTVARTAHHQWVLLDDGHKIALDHEPRPLVVIDPEDREQVERLATEYVKTWLGPQEVTSPESVDQMQAALREFANPTPELDEPAGLGAVVEDSDGHRHVRTSDRTVNPWRSDRDGCNRPWGIFRVTRVLSEGVQP